MLNLHRLDAINCTTALEVELLAALVYERRLRMKAPPPKEIPAQRRWEFVVDDRIVAGCATIAQIQQAVSKCFRVPIQEIKSDRRTQRTTIARHVAVMLAHSLTLHSYPELGRMFGDRDHTTMLHAVQKLHWLQQELVAELSTEDTLAVWVTRAFDKIMVDRAHKRPVLTQVAVA